MKILVVGDSYCPVEVFERVFAPLANEHNIEYVQLDMDDFAPALTASEQRIREYAGTPCQIQERMVDQDILVVHGGAVTDAVLDASPNLKLVCCARGGPVNVDVVAATERGIPVAITPGKNAEAVADLTVAFLIMLARGLVKAAAHIRDGGRLGESTYEGARWFGHDLRGHTLGLVGYGSVGRGVARRARAFGMDVVAYDPYVAQPEAEKGVRMVDVAPLLAEARFVSLHARVTPENENMMGAREFGAMQQGTFFVNTARETLVDEGALFSALSSGHLAGAALDVIRPPEAGVLHPLLAFDNVIITPHLGGATAETLSQGAEMVAAEIKSLAAGTGLCNVVNRGTLAATGQEPKFS